MTANELTYFPVTGYWHSIEAPDLGGSTSNLQYKVISAFVGFFPRLPAGFEAYVTNLDDGSGTGYNTGLVIPPILARILNGQLETINRTNTAGVKLVANSSVISGQIATVSSAGLIYDVQFTNVIYAQDDQFLNNFAFTAPTDTTAVCLTDPNLTRLKYAGPGA